MLDNVSLRLMREGLPHANAPDKVPALRLRTIEEAGKLSVAFTTGILIGIGETMEERVDSLFAIRTLHEKYGHIQEVIRQNFGPNQSYYRREPAQIADAAAQAYWRTGVAEERVDAVLYVLYLIFNEGYASTSGNELIRHELCDEAIRLARVLTLLLMRESLLIPLPEALGLLALLLLHDARRTARVGPDGELILLEAQDRSQWDQGKKQEGLALLERALRMKRTGPYQLQAAISALHVQAQRPEETDWPQIAALYGLLLRMTPSPVIELNRIVAIAMADGPLVGLADRTENREVQTARSHRLGDGSSVVETNGLRYPTKPHIHYHDWTPPRVRLRRYSSMGRLTKLVTLALSVLALTLGGSAVAGASSHHHGKQRAHNRASSHHRGHSKSRARKAGSNTAPNDTGSGDSSEGASGSSEGASDDAAQAAACQKAGIDPNADNVQYDDQTGTCSLDTGGSDNGGPDNGGGR